MSYQWFLSSHQGGRDEQQDACRVEEQDGALMAVVCDGAGGHAGGAAAANAAVEAAGRVFRVAAKSRSFAAFPMQAAEEGHKAVLALGAGSSQRGSRSTIALVALAAGAVCWMHVGDSRIYRLKRGSVVSRTSDHSVVQMLVARGMIKEHEMGSHRDQGRLLRVLGAEEPLRPTVGNAPLEPGDAFLLCSDGFWERMQVSEIENFFREPSPEALDRLVATAVNRNGEKSDNVSAVALLADNVQGNNPAKEACLNDS